MIFFLIFLIIVLLLISISDYAKEEIPNSLNLGLGILGITYIIINFDVKTFWVPITISIATFILFFLFFMITGEALIGGGDMKMICISMLFLTSFKALFHWSIYLSIFLLIGVVITYIKGQKAVRCGPYFSLALLFTLFGSKIDNLNGVSITFVYILTTIITSYFYLSLKGEWMFNEKNMEIF